MLSSFQRHSLPQLAFFETEIPTFYKESLAREESISEWVAKLIGEDAIETISENVLMKVVCNKLRVN